MLLWGVIVNQSGRVQPGIIKFTIYRLCSVLLFCPTQSLWSVVVLLSVNHKKNMTLLSTLIIENLNQLMSKLINSLSLATD